MFAPDAEKTTDTSDADAKVDDQLSEICNEFEKKKPKTESEEKSQKKQALTSILNLNSEHFHAMLSYRVNTEGDGSAGSSNFAHQLYQALTIQANRQRTKNDIPLGEYPNYVKYPGWQAQDHEINLSCRVFLDTVCLREGFGWKKAFSRAVCNSILFIPILSCHAFEVKGQMTYAGSVGQMVGWDPVKEDRVDNVLLEIGMANALMDLPQEERWLHSIVPILVGEKDDRGFKRFNFNVVDTLSSRPSIQTNKEVARLLIEYGYPQDKAKLSKILRRSIKDNIKPLLELQGINMSELGLSR
jgi:hypothetical protein